MSIVERILDLVAVFCTKKTYSHVLNSIYLQVYAIKVYRMTQVKRIDDHYFPHNSNIQCIAWARLSDTCLVYLSRTLRDLELSILIMGRLHLYCSSLSFQCLRTGSDAGKTLENLLTALTHPFTLLSIVLTSSWKSMVHKILN